jgi:hypothetical protein
VRKLREEKSEEEPMTAIVTNILTWVMGRVPGLREASTFSHPWSLPKPPEVHMTLSPDFVDKFEEVLVIGDIHGCYDEMMELIHGEDAASDRVLKLFVGDLVNKGPKSKQVLEYLVNEKQACFSVRGNHDEVVIRESINYKKDPKSLASKNLWIKDLSPHHVDYLRDLPYTISLPSLKTIIVHAGLIPGKPLAETDPMDMVTMRNVVADGDHFDKPGVRADKSGKEGEPWASQWPGPDHVYFGHDAKRKLQRNEFTTGLDTGCVYGFSLTAVFIKGQRKGTFVTVKAAKAYQKVKGEII